VVADYIGVAARLAIGRTCLRKDYFLFTDEQLAAQNIEVAVGTRHDWHVLRYSQAGGAIERTFSRLAETD